jgi:hypothetical protein
VNRGNAEGVGIGIIIQQDHDTNPDSRNYLLVFNREQRLSKPEPACLLIGLQPLGKFYEMLKPGDMPDGQSRWKMDRFES